MREPAIKGFLKRKFPGVRETAEGYRINKANLNQSEIKHLSKAPGNPDIEIKGSGEGLVIYINDN